MERLGKGIRHKVGIGTLVAVFALLCVSAAWAKTWPPEYEERVSREVQAEIEKEMKVLDEHEKLELVEQIAEDLKPHSPRPDVTYTVKIIETEEVNAFSIPGSVIYFTTGLFEDVHSVHELAGVVAHEMAHNSYYDSLEQADRNKKLFMGSIGAALVAILVGGDSDQVSGVLTAGEYIRRGMLSHYSLDFERRADRSAVEFMIASGKYNPVGLLTFMERLAAQERRRPQIELGIYADHPDTEERCRLIIRQIEAAGIEINRRAVTRWDPPQVETRETDTGEQVVVTLWDIDLFHVQHPGEAADLNARGEAFVAQLKEKLAGGLSSFEVWTEKRGDNGVVLARGKELLVITPQDGEAAGMEPEELAAKVNAQMRAAFHKEELARRF